MKSLLLTLFLVQTLVLSPLPAYTNQEDKSAENSIVQEAPTQNSDAVKIQPQQDTKVQTSSTYTNYIEALKKLNFYIDETWVPDLDERYAVIRFQAAHNLMVDGFWGNQSQAALEKRLKDKNFQYPDTVAQAPTEGKWITINLSRRILTLYENTAVVKKYPIATGNPPDLTPEGKFSIVIKVVDPDWGGGGYTEPVAGGTPENPLGYRWMGLSEGGGSSYGIHGNNSPYSIGSDASHGCIRMINSDVEEFFEIVGCGTQVWIGFDNTIKEWGVDQKDYAADDPAS